MPTLDQFRGCLLGLALGDALGASYEGGIVERLLWRAIGKTKSGEMRFQVVVCGSKLLCGIVSVDFRSHFC